MIPTFESKELLEFSQFGTKNIEEIPKLETPSLSSASAADAVRPYANFQQSRIEQPSSNRRLIDRRETIIKTLRHDPLDAGTCVRAGRHVVTSHLQMILKMQSRYLLTIGVLYGLIGPMSAG